MISQPVALPATAGLAHRPTHPASRSPCLCAFEAGASRATKWPHSIWPHAESSLMTFVILGKVPDSHILTLSPQTDQNDRALFQPTWKAVMKRTYPQLVSLF